MWSYTETTVWLSEELKWVQWKGCLSRLQRPFFIKPCMCKWQLLCCGICCIIKRRVRDVWNLTLIKKKKHGQIKLLSKTSKNYVLAVRYGNSELIQRATLRIGMSPIRMRISGSRSRKPRPIWYLSPNVQLNFAWQVVNMDSIASATAEVWWNDRYWQKMQYRYQ